MQNETDLDYGNFFQFWLSTTAAFAAVFEFGDQVNSFSYGESQRKKKTFDLK